MIEEEQGKLRRYFFFPLNKANGKNLKSDASSKNDDDDVKFLLCLITLWGSNVCACGQQK